MLDRGIRYASLPETIRDQWLWDAQSIVIAGTHGKTTTTALTGWLLTAAGADPTVLIGGIARNFGDDGASYRDRQGQGVRHRRRRIRQRLLRQDGEVPEVPARHRRRQQHRVRSRRHLSRPRRSAPGVPAARQPRAAQRPDAARRRQPGRGGAGGATRAAACRRSGLSTGAEWRGARYPRRRSGTSVPRAARGSRISASSRCRCSAITTCATRSPRSPIGVDLGLDVERLRNGLAAFKGVKRRLEVVGEARGVTVYDDFAHHPTAVDETLKAVRRVVAGQAHLGDLRAALGLVVPARLSGRLRAGVCRRGRSGDRVGVSIEPAAGGAAVRSRSSSPISPPKQRARAAPAGRRRDRRRGGARGARRRSDRGDVERRLRRHPSQAAGGAARENSAVR